MAISYFHCAYYSEKEKFVNELSYQDFLHYFIYRDSDKKMTDVRQTSEPKSTGTTVVDEDDLDIEIFGADDLVLS